METQTQNFSPETEKIEPIRIEYKSQPAALVFIKKQKVPLFIGFIVLSLAATFLVVSPNYNSSNLKTQLVSEETKTIGDLIAIPQEDDLVVLNDEGNSNENMNIIEEDIVTLNPEEDTNSASTDDPFSVLNENTTTDEETSVIKTPIDSENDGRVYKNNQENVNGMIALETSELKPAAPLSSETTTQSGPATYVVLALSLLFVSLIWKRKNA